MYLSTRDFNKLPIGNLVTNRLLRHSRRLLAGISIEMLKQVQHDDIRNFHNC